MKLARDWAFAMGIGLPGWSMAVGSCLAIQASILLTGSLLGLGQRFEAKAAGHAAGQKHAVQGILSPSRNHPLNGWSPLGAQRERKI